MIFIENSTQHGRIHNLFKSTRHIYRKDPILVHKINLNTFIKIEIVQIMFSYPNRNKLEINNRKFENPPILLNNPWFKKEE